MSARRFTVPVELPGDPTEDNHAATKKYVDDNAGNGTGGGHPHIEVVEIADASENDKWEIRLEADDSLTFNFIGT